MAIAGPCCLICTLSLVPIQLIASKESFRFFSLKIFFSFLLLLLIFRERVHECVSDGGGAQRDGEGGRESQADPSVSLQLTGGARSHGPDITT